MTKKLSQKTQKHKRTKVFEGTQHLAKEFIVEKSFKEG
jgi:hypothetical protein